MSTSIHKKILKATKEFSKISFSAAIESVFTHKSNYYRKIKSLPDITISDLIKISSISGITEKELLDLIIKEVKTNPDL